MFNRPAAIPPGVTTLDALFNSFTSSIVFNPVTQEITGDFILDSSSKLAILGENRYISNGIYKMTVTGNKIDSLSVYITPDAGRTYCVCKKSKVVFNEDGTIDAEKSSLVKPKIAIREPFYIWGENIEIDNCIGVASIDAVARTPVFSMPVEKRVASDKDALKQYIGCSPEQLANIVSQLKSENPESKPVVEEFVIPEQKLFGFNISTCKINTKMTKRKLTPAEEKLLLPETNTAKVKLEKTEAQKLKKDTHRYKAKVKSEKAQAERVQHSTSVLASSSIGIFSTHSSESVVSTTSVTLQQNTR